VLEKEIFRMPMSIRQKNKLYSYSTKPPNTARPPYKEIDSVIIRDRRPMGMIMGARELRATTVTPARRGAPRCRYLSFLSSTVRIEIK
jgi:hypothetical protein